MILLLGLSLTALVLIGMPLGFAIIIACMAVVAAADINPVIVGARGQGSVAVDAVVYRG